MPKRFDVVAPKKTTDRDGNEKTYWNKIGVMWQDGDKMRLNLDLVPVGWDGFALISEPKEKESPGKPQSRSSGGRPSNDDMPDDVPF